jgi:hypothetical protein
MDDFLSDNESDFGNEAKAFERAGGGLLQELLTGVYTDDIDMKKRDMPPIDRFLISTDAMCRSLKLSTSDINTILTKARYQVSGIEYKNYVAFILGFLASEGGSSLKVKKVRSVIQEILPQVADRAGVEPEDVVRYARYWREFL